MRCDCSLTDWRGGGRTWLAPHGLVHPSAMDGRSKVGEREDWGRLEERDDTWGPHGCEMGSGPGWTVREGGDGAGVGCHSLECGPEAQVRERDELGWPLLR